VGRTAPWRIHELTRDFRLEDVWALPGRGGPDDVKRRDVLVGDGDRLAALTDGVGAVAAGVSADALGRRQQPAPVVSVAEEHHEAGPGVEARKATQVHRSRL